MLLNTVVKTVKRKSHRGDQAITTDLITTDIIACINESIRDLVKLIPKRYWRKTGSSISLTLGVAGTPAVYSLASDVQEPINFFYVDNNVLYVMEKIASDREWIRGIWNPANSVNFPRFYREIGADSSGYKQIELFPIPHKSLTLQNEYYKTQGSDLTTSDLSTQIPNFPDYVQDCVEKGALYYFYKGFDDQAQVIAKADYEESKKALEFSDDQDKDLDVSLRLCIPNYNMPGFTLE